MKFRLPLQQIFLNEIIFPQPLLGYSRISGDDVHKPIADLTYINKHQQIRRRIWIQMRMRIRMWIQIKVNDTCRVFQVKIRVSTLGGNQFTAERNNELFKTPRLAINISQFLISSLSPAPAVYRDTAHGFGIFTFQPLENNEEELLLKSIRGWLTDNWAGRRWEWGWWEDNDDSCKERQIRKSSTRIEEGTVTIRYILLKTIVFLIYICRYCFCSIYRSSWLLILLFYGSQLEYIFYLQFIYLFTTFSRSKSNNSLQ